MILRDTADLSPPKTKGTAEAFTFLAETQNSKLLFLEVQLAERHLPH